MRSIIKRLSDPLMILRMVRVARLELAASWSQTRRPTNWATPGYEVKENFAKWSNMWSRKSYHSFAQLSTEVIGGNCKDKGEYATFGAVELFWCSCSQTRRPTNWATPGYEVKEKIAKWSNMWSRKFYHIFAEHSTEIKAGVRR